MFGEQVEPHAHDWRVEVHVAGPVDPLTGWCVDLGALDACLADATTGWDGGDIRAHGGDVTTSFVVVNEVFRSPCPRVGSR